MENSQCSILNAQSHPLTYDQIQGWFNDEVFYERMVWEAPKVATFVEVGCWLGKSTCFLAGQIAGSGKAIALLAVDTWKGSAGEPALLEAVAAAGGDLFEQFARNLKAARVDGWVRPLRMESVVAAGLIEDESVDFVFIDADHSFEAVCQDIDAWRPKVKVGGTLAGHDWNTYESVRQAVVLKLGAGFGTEGNCWVWRKG